MDDSLKYSSDKVAIVREARKKGLSDAQILAIVTQAEVAAERRRIVLDWAAALGLTTEEALGVARKAGLIKR